MALTEYKRKRNFKRTPEPAGGKRRTATAPQFVVQKHAATRLHYDFRLELDGVLKSWAVPKGPSLDPGVKSLAVQVEDHPLEYAAFEGVIPKGEYGGGTVMVWDRGAWSPEGDARAGLQKGKLSFELFGEKLNGGWSLVQMHGKAGEDGKNWLLIKRDDEHARSGRQPEIVKSAPLSVLSGREMDEIATDADRVWTENGAEKGHAQNGKPRTANTAKSKKLSSAQNARATPKKTKSLFDSKQLADVAGARRSPFPMSFRPQLATLASTMPSGDNWIHELKFDGYRILAFLEDGHVRLVSRNDKDWTRRFPTVVRELKKLPLKSAILDGEVVALDEKGISSFQRLQNSLRHGEAAELVYYVFDVPYLEGFDLTATPLSARKMQAAKLLLAGHLANDGVLRYSDHIQGQGHEVWQQACRASMEGVVSKRADSAYVQSRARNWLKVKCHQGQEFVIGGYTKPSGTRVGFGALLLGYYDDGKLRYSGRVGTGFTDDSLRQLLSEMKARRSAEPPFVNPPNGARNRDVTWLKPELVAEIEFAQWTDDGLLRQPSFQGLREDKPAKKVVREQATAGVGGAMSNEKANGKAKSATNRPTEKRKRAAEKSRRKEIETSEADRFAGVQITHPDRVLYPEQGITKRDLAEYYDQVADWILPDLINRPLTMVRCPGGRGGQCFYQKHLTGDLPESMRAVVIEEKTKRDEYVVIDNLAGLISMVQMGVLEIHPWPARADSLERPDRVVFDFDPGEGVAWKDVVSAAKEARDRLEELGLTSFVRTTGGKGLHVVVPIARRIGWDQLKSFAKSFADAMVRDDPARFVATMSKAKRRGKIFVDYLRNHRGATAIASYSTRARPGAPVATPLSWSELTARIKPASFNVLTVPKRLSRLANDPWNGLLSTKQTITADMQKSVDE